MGRLMERAGCGDELHRWMKDTKLMDGQRHNRVPEDHWLFLFNNVFCSVSGQRKERKRERKREEKEKEKETNQTTPSHIHLSSLCLHHRLVHHPCPVASPSSTSPRLDISQIHISISRPGFYFLQPAAKRNLVEKKNATNRSILVQNHECHQTRAKAQCRRTGSRADHSARQAMRLGHAISRQQDVRNVCLDQRRMASLSCTRISSNARTATRAFTQAASRSSRWLLILPRILHGNVQPARLVRSAVLLTKTRC